MMCLDKKKNISGTPTFSFFFFFYFFPFFFGHQPSSIRLSNGSVSLNSEQLDKNETVRQTSWNSWEAIAVLKRPIRVQLWQSGRCDRWRLWGENWAHDCCCLRYQTPPPLSFSFFFPGVCPCVLLSVDTTLFLSQLTSSTSLVFFFRDSRLVLEVLEGVYFSLFLWFPYQYADVGNFTWWLLLQRIPPGAYAVCFFFWLFSFFLYNCFLSLWNTQYELFVFSLFVFTRHLCRYLTHPRAASLAPSEIKWLANWSETLALFSLNSF